MLSQKRNLDSFAYGLFCLVLLATPFYFWRFSVLGIPSTILEVLIYAAFFVFVASGRLRFIRFWPSIVAAIFVLCALIGALRDPSMRNGLGLWKAYFFDGFLVFLLVFGFLKEKKQANILSWLTAGAFISAALAIFRFYTGVRSLDGRLLGLEGLSPNYLAMFLSPILVLALNKIRTAENWSGRIGYLLAATAIFWALYLAGSRGAFIAIAVGLLVFVYSYFKQTGLKNRAKLFFWVPFIALMAFSVWFFYPKWDDLGRAGSSQNIRFYIWSTSLEIAQKNPLFGVGLSNYQNYFSDLTSDRVNYPEFISPQALTAHNLYLHFYLTGGVALISSFILLILSSRFWRGKETAVLAALVVLLAYGLFDTPIFRNDLAILFWVLLGLAYV